jgi:hypothetical protein
LTTQFSKPPRREYQKFPNGKIPSNIHSQFPVMFKHLHSNYHLKFYESTNENPLHKMNFHQSVEIENKKCSESGKNGIGKVFCVLSEPLETSFIKEDYA